MSDAKTPDQGASQCFLCSRTTGGCLECRTRQLVDDIRAQGYQSEDRDQNRLEWEERALIAETKLAAANKWNDRLRFELAHLHAGSKAYTIQTIYGVPIDAYVDFLSQLSAGLKIDPVTILIERDGFKKKLLETQEKLFNLKNRFQRFQEKRFW